MGKHNHHDVEAPAAGGSSFPPPPPAVGVAGVACTYMIERPELRWAFIRKVYAIVATQLVVTVAIAAAVYSVPAIRRFFLARTPASLAAFVLVIVAPLIVMLPTMFLRKKHPINLILLALFTICMSCAIGLGCLSSKAGIAIIEAASLTFGVVFGLTLYTFWAAKRGHDFSFLRPFLVAAFLVLVLYGLIQMLVPTGKVATTVYGCVAALVFSGFIIYDTDNLIKRHAYDEYVTAAISLYLDTVNIFMAIFTALDASDS
ncbi:protein LIFEGUARD 2-like [Oryza glaberrima]|nr:protein LIFEGUARD 2-like [Oryza glaberrima]